VKAALIGAGQIARQHLSCLQGLPGVEVAAVCDLSPSVAECASERYRIPSWYTDHRAMLREVRPDVIHVTTPPTSHFRLAMDSLEAGAHVIVEKPATSTFAELDALVRRAGELGRALVEDYNYLFNSATREILRRVESGEFGAVIHVEAMISLDILGPGGFADPNAPHPCLALAGGAIADFLPHLASLANLVDAERGTAALAFSASSQPNAFWLRVHGERMQATANLFETRLTFDRLRPGPKPVQPLLNGLEEGKSIRRAALGTLLQKFSGGPGTYEGLFRVLARTYQSLADGSTLPIPAQQVLEVNRLIAALKPEGSGA